MTSEMRLNVCLIAIDKENEFKKLLTYILFFFSMNHSPVKTKNLFRWLEKKSFDCACSSARRKLNLPIPKHVSPVYFIIRKAVFIELQPNP